MKNTLSGLAAAFGQAVRDRRRRLKLSQEELAWRAGLNRSYVTDVERGARNVSLSTIDRLARALQTPLFLLLHDVDMARAALPASDPEGSGDVTPIRWKKSGKRSQWRDETAAAQCSRTAEN
jgi:transcriptional regulator with XRE-family HTH domain